MAAETISDDEKFLQKVRLTYYDRHAFPSWITAKHIQRLKQYTTVYYDYGEDLKVVKDLQLIKEPTNFSGEQLFKTEDFQNMMGFTEGLYNTFFKTNNKLAPNTATFCKTIFNNDENVVMNVINSIGYSLDDQTQPDYIYFVDKGIVTVEKQRELQMKYEKVFEKIFVCAKEKNFKYILMNLLGCNNLSKLYISTSELSKENEKERNDQKRERGRGKVFFQEVWYPAFKRVFDVYNDEVKKDEVKKDEGLKNHVTLLFFDDGTSFSRKQKNELSLKDNRQFIEGFFPNNIETIKANLKSLGSEDHKQPFDFLNNELLIVNACDPVSIPGNGHRLDSSLNGSIGKCSMIAPLCFAPLNDTLLNTKTYNVILPRISVETLKTLYTPYLCFPHWVTDKIIEKNKKDAVVYYDTSDNFEEVKQLILEREPTNIGFKSLYKPEELQKRLGWKHGYYGRFFSNNEHKRLAPNVALFTKTNFLETFDMNIIHSIGFAFDDVRQPDYIYFFNKKKIIEDKKVQELKQAYERVFEKIFVCAISKNLGYILMSFIGCEAFSTYFKTTKGTGKRQLFEEVWFRAFKNVHEKYKKQVTISFFKDGDNHLNKTIQEYIPNVHFFGHFPGCHKEIEKYMKDIKKDFGDILIVNAWDPISIPGNGNAGDKSLDGFIGCSTSIGPLGFPPTNEWLYDTKAYFPISYSSSSSSSSSSPSSYSPSSSSSSSSVMMGGGGMARGDDDDDMVRPSVRPSRRPDGDGERVRNRYNSMMYREVEDEKKYYEDKAEAERMADVKRAKDFHKKLAGGGGMARGDDDDDMVRPSRRPNGDGERVRNRHDSMYREVEDEKKYYEDKAEAERMADVKRAKDFHKKLAALRGGAGGPDIDDDDDVKEAIRLSMEMDEAENVKKARGVRNRRGDDDITEAIRLSMKEKQEADDFKKALELNKETTRMDDKIGKLRRSGGAVPGGPRLGMDVSDAEQAIIDKILELSRKENFGQTKSKKKATKKSHKAAKKKAAKKKAAKKKSKSC